MTAVSAGPGKSASQIYFYDWSDNYRKVNVLVPKFLPNLTILQEGNQGTKGSRGPKN